MTYALETKYKIGDIVYHRTEEQAKFVIVGFSIIAADNAGNVITFDVICSMPDGTRASLNITEIEKLEQAEHGR